MPYIRRYRLRKPLYRRRRPVMPMSRLPRRTPMRSNTTPMFTETFKGEPILWNGAGVNSPVQLIQNNVGQIPQFASYAALYNQYRMLRVTAIFVPSTDSHGFDTPTVSAVAAPRMVYAIQDSAQQLNPTVESDVLQYNGCKIRIFNKPVKVSWKPVSAAADALVQGGFASVNRKYQWYGTTSSAVQHNGLAVSFTSSLNPVGTPVLAQVYFKITFALKDPK